MPTPRSRHETSDQCDQQLDSDSSSSPSHSQDSPEQLQRSKRREKNRIAAQRSRQRQMQRADTLHVESEMLERRNAALRREIVLLRQEIRYLASVLSGHQPACNMAPLKMAAGL